MTPSPVITLNRAVAVSKTAGPGGGAGHDRALEAQLSSYFYFHGAGGFLKQLGRRREAREAAFDHAIALANSAPEAAHIRQHLDSLAGASAGLFSQVLSRSPRPVRPSFKAPDGAHARRIAMTTTATMNTAAETVAAIDAPMKGVIPHSNVVGAAKAAEFYQKASASGS